MKQNIYDTDSFFTKYSQMSRSVNGLAGAGEWKTLEKMKDELRRPMMFIVSAKKK